MILTDWHLNTRLKRMYPDEWGITKARICTGREREVLKTVVNGTQITAAETKLRRVIIPGTVLRAELGIHPIKDKQRHGKIEMAI